MLLCVWFAPSQICTSQPPRILSSPPPKSPLSLSLRLNLCTSEHANEQYVAAVAVGSLCSVASTSRVSQVRGYKCRWFQETHLGGEEILSSYSLLVPSACLLTGQLRTCCGPLSKSFNKSSSLTRCVSVYGKWHLSPCL